MTAWARLTWQAADPSSFARTVAGWLDVEARPGGLIPDAWTLDLASGWLEIRPWVRESPADNPLAGGRLMLEAVPGGEPSPEDTDAGASRALRLVGTGWATVELDRAEEELSMWLADDRGEPAVDAHLGAHTRVRGAGGLPGDELVMLEPNTEGRLAASLVRDGEGPCALYLRPRAGLTPWLDAARRRGLTFASREIGPLGPQVLLLGGPVAGPHLLLLDTPTAPKRNPATGTIGR